MTDNITPIPTPEKDGMQAALATLQRNLPVVMEYGRISAQLRWSQYSSYIGAGFTEQQALELVKAAVQGGQTT